MQLLCPECMGPLAVSDPGVARCTLHGGEFKILFSRETRNTMENTPLIPSEGAAPDPPPLMPSGMRCVQHPAVEAVRQCQACGACMCATCDFALPDGMHLCPACATKPRTAVGPKRKRSMIWSFVCAAGATLGMIWILGFAAARPAHTEVERQALGTLFTFVVMIPSIVGFGLGLGSIDRRYVNPPSLWAATIWNGVILGIFLLLCIIGLMR